MKNRVCKLSFHYFGKSALDTFSNGVKNGIFSNETVFVTPPLTDAQLEQIISNYLNTLAEYEAYGKIKKTAFLKAKEKLINALNSLATYVDTIANGDPSTILLAGYEPTAEGRHDAPDLKKIEVILVTPSKVSGQVFIETTAIVDKGVSGYGLILVSGEPLTADNFKNGVLNLTANEGQKIIIDFSKSRRKIATGLDPTINYYCYMFAINANSISPLSDARMVRCI